MSLYKELEQINKSLKRKAIDQADFRFLLPNLLKKYKPCEDCELLDVIDCLGGKKWVRRTIYD